MTKNDLEVGNWVYRINNFTGEPLEIIYVLKELKDYSVKYFEIDFPNVEESEIPYNDLTPILFTDVILRKLGFTDFETVTSIEDFAGFKLYKYSEMQFAFNGINLYQFILEIKQPGNYTGVTPFGTKFENVHEFQNFINNIE